MSSLIQHAKFELRSRGLFDADADFDGEVAHAVVSLIYAFAAQGHSGGSADMTLELFDRLARFKPLSPLTGELDEWNDMSEMAGSPLWQNKRYSAVFKNETTAWINAEGGGHTPITFPYTVE